MLVKGQSVMGLNIITIDTGSVVESVDDIAYNPETQRVEALLVSSGGLFSSAKAVLMDDVHNIGEDAVVIPDASVIKPVKELGGSVKSISDSNKHLVKTNVVTVDGKELGRVTDIYFDSANGEVDSMEVSQGGLKTITEGKKSIKPSDIVTIGADATIVSTYIEMKLDEQGEEGGLKGAFNDAKAKAAEISENVKESAQDAAENIKDKSAEFKEVAQDRAEQARDTLEEKRAQAQQKVDELQDDAQQKGRELSTTINQKTAELQAATNNTSRDVELKADELAHDTKAKIHELRETTQHKADQTKKKIDTLAQQAEERTQHVKDISRDKSSTTRHQGRKMVEQTKEKFEDATKSIEVEKTKITKKK